MPKARNFVMVGLTQNPRLNEAQSKADSKAYLKTDANNAPLAVRGGPDWDRQETYSSIPVGQP